MDDENDGRFCTCVRWSRRIQTKCLEIKIFKILFICYFIKMIFEVFNDVIWQPCAHHCSKEVIVKLNWLDNKKDQRLSAGCFKPVG